MEYFEENLKNMGIRKLRRLCKERAEWRKMGKSVNPILGCNARRRN